jgi:hypothetical protein
MIYAVLQIAVQNAAIFVFKYDCRNKLNTFVTDSRSIEIPSLLILWWPRSLDDSFVRWMFDFRGGLMMNRWRL